MSINTIIRTFQADTLNGSPHREVRINPIRAVRCMDASKLPSDPSPLIESMRSLAREIMLTSTGQLRKMFSSDYSKKIEHVGVSLKVGDDLKRNISSFLLEKLGPFSASDQSMSRIAELASLLVYEDGSNSDFVSVRKEFIRHKALDGQGTINWHQHPDAWQAYCDPQSALAFFLGADDCIEILKNSGLTNDISEGGWNRIREDLLEKAGWGVWRSLQAAIDGKMFDEGTQVKIEGPHGLLHIVSERMLFGNPHGFHWTNEATHPYVGRQSHGDEQVLLPPHLMAQRRS